MATKKAKKPALNFAPPVATVAATVKLEEPISAQLSRYQDFIEKTNGVRPSTDDIINRALERLRREIPHLYTLFPGYHGQLFVGRHEQGSRLFYQMREVAELNAHDLERVRKIYRMLFGQRADLAEDERVVKLNVFGRGQRPHVPSG